MKVILRQRRREVEVTGISRVDALLKHLDVVAESVLVIRGNELLTIDMPLDEADVVELRPVISGG